MSTQPDKQPYLTNQQKDRLQEVFNYLLDTAGKKETELIVARFFLTLFSDSDAIEVSLKIFEAFESNDPTDELYYQYKLRTHENDTII